MGWRKRCSGAALVVVVGVLAAEALHWRAARSATARRRASAECGFIVLGHPSRRSGELGAVQRWRVQIARRSFAPVGGTMIFTGGSRRGGPSEAEVMARYAESLGTRREVMVLEEQATNTWENVELSLPWVDGLGSIAFCSDPMHAARARRYALELRPDLRCHLVGADDYRFLERWWIKLPATAYELGIRASGCAHRLYVGLLDALY